MVTRVSCLRPMVEPRCLRRIRGADARSGDRLTCPTRKVPVSVAKSQPSQKALDHAPRADPAEFRARDVAFVRAGKQQKQTADELGIHPITLSKWLCAATAGRRRQGLRGDSDARSTGMRYAQPFIDSTYGW